MSVITLRSTRRGGAKVRCCRTYLSTVANRHEVTTRRTPRDKVVEDGGAAVVFVLVAALAALVGAQAPRAELQGAV